MPVLFRPTNSEGLPPTWNIDGGVQLDDATHTAVVVLSDARMNRVTDDGTALLWTTFLEDGIALASASLGRHSVFGIVVGGDGYLLSDKRTWLASRKPQIYQ